MVSSIADFLENDGAIDIICAFNPFGMGFDTIVEETTITRRTVSRRLTEAENLNLVVPSENVTYSVASGIYLLTFRGLALKHELGHHHMCRAFEDYREAKRRYEDSITEFVGDFEDREAEFVQEYSDEPYTKENIE